MRCQNCGKNLSIGDEECPFCGVAVSNYIQYSYRLNRRAAALRDSVFSDLSNISPNRLNNNTPFADRMYSIYNYNTNQNSANPSDNIFSTVQSKQDTALTYSNENQQQETDNIYNNRIVFPGAENMPIKSTFFPDGVPSAEEEAVAYACQSEYIVPSTLYNNAGASVNAAKHTAKRKNRAEELEKKSDKDWVTTLFLAVFGGMLGLHRFYAGKYFTGALYTCTLGGFGVGWSSDIAALITGNFKDAKGGYII